VGAYQELQQPTYPGTGTPVSIDLPRFPGHVDLVISYPIDIPGNGILAAPGGRWDGENRRAIIEPDAGGAPCRYRIMARHLHSTLRRPPAPISPLRQIVTIAAASSEVVSFAPTPTNLPGLTHIQLASNPGAPASWAVTAFGAFDFTVTNFDPVVPIEILAEGSVAHSIVHPNRLSPGVFAILTTAATVAIPHGLGVTPDVIGSFPLWDPGDPNPSGAIRIPQDPDADNIYVALTGNGFQKVIFFPEATHSIQQ